MPVKIRVSFSVRVMPTSVLTPAKLAVALLAAGALSAGGAQAVSARSAVAPAGGQIAYLHFVPPGVHVTLEVINPTGKGGHALRTVSGFVDRLSWSPDGKRLAFSVEPSSGAGRPVLYVMNANGKGRRRVAKGFSAPAFSPDGSKIVAVGANGDGIYVMSATGSGRKKIIGGHVGFPSWSPDGTKITFMLQLKNGETAIAVANSDGSGQQTVLESCPPRCSPTNVVPSVKQPPAALDRPTWSPDGKEIAFDLGVYAPGKGRGAFLWEVATMNADGSGVTVLTPIHPPLASEAPTWSPDGTQIAFTRDLCFPKVLCFPHEGSERTTLDVMDTSGANAKALTHGALAPAWQP